MATDARQALRDLVTKWTRYRQQQPRHFNVSDVTDERGVMRENILIDEFVRDMSALLADPPAPPFQHGVSCPKAPHNGRGGYLHGADDDRPYRDPHTIKRKRKAIAR